MEDIPSWRNLSKTILIRKSYKLTHLLNAIHPRYKEFLTEIILKSWKNEPSSLLDWGIGQVWWVLFWCRLVSAECSQADATGKQFSVMFPQRQNFYGLCFRLFSVIIITEATALDMTKMNAKKVTIEPTVWLPRLWLNNCCVSWKINIVPQLTEK